LRPYRMLVSEAGNRGHGGLEREAKELFTSGGRPTLVFAGGGHSQLYSLRRTRELTEGGFDVVLVNPSRFLYYSGMAPGLLSRIYNPEEARIDVKRLVEKGGGHFVEDWIKEIRPKSGEVLLESAGQIRYDAMSVALGSGVPDKNLAPGVDHVVPVKPVENMVSLRGKLRELEAGPDREPKVLIVGGGPAGCEVACNTKKLFEEYGIDGRITIADAGDALLGSAPERAQREIEKFLRSKEVEVLLGSGVASIQQGAGHTCDGLSIDFDMAVLAVRTKPPGIFRESGLATGGDDGLWVNRYLQSISDPRIFGGGDSVSFRGESLTRLGVFAIRQGPVLFHNLKAYLGARPLKEFKPQKAFLYVLNLGDGTGLAIYGPLVWRSRLAWRLKRYIDVKFVKEYQCPESEPECEGVPRVVSDGKQVDGESAATAVQDEAHRDRSALLRYPPRL